MNKIREFLLNYPNSSISTAYNRINNILDNYDVIIFGFSGGKDSSLTANLLLYEINKRKEKIKYLNKEYLTKEDYKWVDNKNIYGNIMHPEWLYSNVTEYINTFIKENKDNANFFYKCIELGWSSIITFGPNRIISWDPKYKSQWIQEYPNIENFDIVTNNNINNKRNIKINNKNIPNYGLGNKKLKENYNCWTFSGQDEDYEQETFIDWIGNQYPVGTKIANLVSIRMEESLDRRKILSQSENKTGKYGYQKSSNGNIIDIISPIYDMKTKDVWRCFNLFNFNYSKIYDEMYESGIPLKNQRVASLLNIYAANSIQNIKAIEPILYNKLINRFNNIELISTFAKKGLYSANKPRDMYWNGINHIKAGYSKNDINNISNKYEKFINLLKIKNYTRNNNEFIFDNINIDDYLMNLNINLLDKKLINLYKELSIIHYNWKDYCLYLLNTSSEFPREQWKEKMVSDILKHRFQGVNSTHTALDALNILTELENNYTESLIDEYWEEKDWKLYDFHKKSLKPIISFIRYPMESIEREANIVINDIIKRKDIELIKKSKYLKEIILKWLYRKPDYYKIWRNKELQKLNKEYPSLEILESMFNLDNLTNEDWVSIKNANNIWFKEDMQSHSSYKKFCIAILKNDVTLTYLNFVPSFKERNLNLNNL